MNALIAGTGAIGSFYGSLLARQGVDVSVIARSDYAHVRQHGIHIRSETKLGDWVFRPKQVVQRAAEVDAYPDYVLVCIKVVENADRASLIRDAVGPDTAIVLIENGIDIEGEVADAFPQNELISGLAFICVSRLEPGEIWHQAYGRLALGNYPRGLSEKAKTLSARFAQAGINCVATEDIITARWQKCVWNAPFSPLSVLSGGLSTNEILSSEEELVRAIMQEVRDIAQAVGHPLPAEIVEANIANTYKMPPYKTSMLLDFEAHRPMEIEAILGNTVRAGQRAGVAVLRLETLYALMKLRSRRPAGQSG
jgi:2-dehydropantoate 2-reductase